MLDKILKTEKISWKALKPYQPKGLKKTTPERLAKLKKSLKENGFASPFYVWQRGKDIISLDGHHRLMVIEEMANEGEKIPEKLTCNFLDIKNENEAKRIFMAYQSHYAQLTNDGFLDFTSDMDMDSIAASFEPFKLNWGFKSTGPTEVDEKDLPTVVKPVSQKKDLFELHSPKGMIHRLYCGDCTDDISVQLLMMDSVADICVTSPPYNAGFIGQTERKGTHQKYINSGDSMDQDQYAEFISMFMELATKSAKTVFLNLQILAGNKLAVIEVLHRFKTMFKDIFYWVKPSGNPQIQKGVVNSRAEVIFVFERSKNPSKVFQQAQFTQGTFWNVIECPVPKNMTASVHKAVFPLTIPLTIMENFSRKKGVVYDPFGGSGTTLIACEESGRVCRMMEIEPHYIDVILKRWLNYVPKGKILRNGKKFTL